MKHLAPNEADLERIAKRNAGYGRAVTGVLNNRTDLLQIHYAYVLRTVNEKELWTVADRKAYFTWLNRAQTWTGGNSYRKFLANIEAESLKGFTENEKLALRRLVSANHIFHRHSRSRKVRVRSGLLILFLHQLTQA